MRGPGIIVESVDPVGIWTGIRVILRVSSFSQLMKPLTISAYRLIIYKIIGSKELQFACNCANESVGIMISVILAAYTHIDETCSC